MRQTIYCQVSSFLRKNFFLKIFLKISHFFRIWLPECATKNQVPTTDLEVPEFLNFHSRLYICIHIYHICHIIICICISIYMYIYTMYIYTYIHSIYIHTLYNIYLDIYILYMSRYILCIYIIHTYIYMYIYMYVYIYIYIYVQILYLLHYCNVN